ncbi:hypothetical protein V8G54_019043 [Vigna mungo]|uniref:indole-3-pyruvate monooxygenase n=1 Tax=Vigna mungo TaxID=3915 RepID=A0AAQ3N9S4_VIGMU
MHSLTVATGENAECVMPEIEGLKEFKGDVIHACGERFKGKKVLVVSCGNSGMELSLDLFNHSASPSILVHSSVHVLPREVFRKSTFELATLMLQWLPLWVVDKILLVLGNMEKFGLERPLEGPLLWKNIKDKTPVLDIGTLEKIKSGDIKVVPTIKRFDNGCVESLLMVKSKMLMQWCLQQGIAKLYELFKTSSGKPYKVFELANGNGERCKSTCRNS